MVTKLGPGVDSFKVGDEVIGFTDRRASHAEYVLVEAQNLTIKPAKVSWEVAGSLAVAGSTAYASVRAVSLKKGDTVAVSGAAGGVGSITVQLAMRAGAEVIGIASPANTSGSPRTGSSRSLTARTSPTACARRESMRSSIRTEQAT